MFTSFDESVFRQAIKAKDYLCLKSNTVCSMWADPTFERGETAEVLQILEKEVPEIFEEYVQQDYEERLERSKWDKRYFTKLTYWFQENFAKERVAYIKEVGSAVYSDAAKQYARSMSIQDKARPATLVKSSPKPASPNAVKPPASAPTKQPVSPSAKAPQGKNTGNFPTARAILTVGALVLMGALLLKLLLTK